MTKVEFFEFYGANSNSGFISAQDVASKSFLGTDLENILNIQVTATNKKYTYTGSFLDSFGNELSYEATIKGKLNFNRPLNQRIIKSVEILTFDPITGLSAEASYKGLKNLTFDQFINRDRDSFKEVMKGNDKIFGNDFTETTLSGYRGNDEIYLRSFNKAVGGAGRDTFFLFSDTRNAQILDFNSNKDSIVIFDDINNYNFNSRFGLLTITNQQDQFIAVVNGVGDFDDITQLITFSGQGI